MTRGTFATFALLVLAAWYMTTRSDAQQDTKTSNAAKLRQLLQQRHDALQQLFEAVKRRNDDGKLHYKHVVAALDDLLKAKLELAASKRERVDICKQRVDNLRSLEEIAEERMRRGSGSIDDKLLATAARLQAEIDCLREES